MPGQAGIALKLAYLTLEKQISVSCKYITAIREEESKSEYCGSRITQGMLSYEVDYALTQL
jgi:hypothetical protein